MPLQRGDINFLLQISKFDRTIKTATSNEISLSMKANADNCTVMSLQVQALSGLQIP